MNWDDDTTARAHLPIPGERDWRTRGDDRWHYTPERGEMIAREFSEAQSARADGTVGARDGGLWGLHYASPQTIPPPSVVRAWTRQYPAFGTLMREAEKLRAERLMEETVVIADTSPLAAPRVALQIASRQRLAESLDRGRYGSGGNTPTNPLALPRPGEQPTALELSDGELLALIEAQRASEAGAGGTPR